jgi:hypothetical protein
MASINRHFKLEGWVMVAVFAAPLVVGIAAAFILPTLLTKTKTGVPLSQSATIERPCNTFVSEFSPLETPLLRNASGQLELVLSFTPAKDEEAERLIAVVSAGAQKLLVKQDPREIKALRIEQRRLVLSVESAAHAADVLELLCFDEKYRKPKMQGAS